MKPLERALSNVVNEMANDYTIPETEFIDDIFNPGEKIRNPFHGQDKQDVKFMFGTKKELDIWIAGTIDKYPLIWLVYPFKETEDSLNSNLYSYKGVRLIFAINTTSEKLVQTRLQTTRFVLDQLTDKFTTLLKRSSFTKYVWMDRKVAKSEEFHPNYSVNQQQTASKVIDVWDAIALECDIHLLPKCIK